MEGISRSSAGKEDGSQKMDDFSGFLVTADLTPVPKEAGISSCMSATLLPCPKKGQPNPRGEAATVLCDKPTRVPSKGKTAPETKEPTSGT